jgi:hypothetical protein
MKVLIWKIRGLNKPFKHREVKKMVNRLKISILCLVETKVKQENVLKVKDAVIPRWEILHNYSAHWLGRIWVCWDPGIASIDAVDIHEQVITCKVIPISCRGPWMLSVVYGANQGPDRGKFCRNWII